MTTIFKQQHQHPLPARQQAHQQHVRISVFFVFLKKIILYYLKTSLQRQHQHLPVRQQLPLRVLLIL